MKRLFAVIAVCLPITLFAQFEQGGNTGNAPNVYGSAVGGSFAPTEEFFKSEKTGKRSYKLKQCAPSNPISGPTDFFVYKNARGIWKLPPTANLGTAYSGSANYKWFDGSKQQDKLTYIAHGYVTDKGGSFVPAGTKVSVWAVMASDDVGNSVFFYFGTDAIIDAPQGRRYPMYWSWEAPNSNPVTHRFITDTGTDRI